MEVMVIPIVFGMLRTIPKGLVKRQEDTEIGQVETTQNRIIKIGQNS